MGIDVDYEFYVHRRDAGRFLTAVAELCDRGAARSTTVVLPDGTSVRLPGGYRFADGQTVDLATVVADGSVQNFDLSLGFPVDGPLRGYQEPDDSGRVTVGYVYLSVGDTFAILPEHWRFRFAPATGTQSRLFLISPSVRETFAGLALSTGASLCLIDTDMGEPEIVVTALGHRVSTRVPGPCLLWRPRGQDAAAFEELSALLAGRPAGPPTRIIGAEHPDFAAAVDSLTTYAQVPPHLWVAPA